MLNHFIPLVIMAEDHHSVSQRTLCLNRPASPFYEDIVLGGVTLYAV